MPHVNRAITTVLSSLVISGVLYGFAAPVLAPYLGPVARPLDQVPWYGIVLLRSVEIFGYIFTKNTNTKDIIMLSVISRTPYLTLLHNSFAIPIKALALTLLIDTISAIVSIRLFCHQIILTAKYPASLRADRTLKAILTAIAASFMSLFVYTGAKTFFPTFLITHFDAIRTVTPIPLPILIFGYMPIGYCLQELIDRYGFMQGAITTMAWSALVSGGNIAMGVKGGDVWGIAGVIEFWQVALLITSGVLGYVLSK